MSVSGNSAEGLPNDPQSISNQISHAMEHDMRPGARPLDQRTSLCALKSFGDRFGEAGGRVIVIRNPAAIREALKGHQIGLAAELLRENATVLDRQPGGVKGLYLKALCALGQARILSYEEAVKDAGESMVSLSWASNRNSPAENLQLIKTRLESTDPFERAVGRASIPYLARQVAELCVEEQDRVIATEIRILRSLKIQDLKNHIEERTAELASADQDDDEALGASPLHGGPIISPRPESDVESVEGYRQQLRRLESQSDEEFRRELLGASDYWALTAPVRQDATLQRMFAVASQLEEDPERVAKLSDNQIQSMLGRFEGGFRAYFPGSAGTPQPPGEPLPSSPKRTPSLESGRPAEHDGRAPREL